MGWRRGRWLCGTSGQAPRAGQRLVCSGGSERKARRGGQACLRLRASLRVAICAHCHAVGGAPRPGWAGGLGHSDPAPQQYNPAGVDSSPQKFPPLPRALGFVGHCVQPCSPAVRWLLWPARGPGDHPDQWSQHGGKRAAPHPVCTLRRWLSAGQWGQWEMERWLCSGSSKFWTLSSSTLGLGVCRPFFAPALCSCKSLLSASSSAKLRPIPEAW